MPFECKGNASKECKTGFVIDHIAEIIIIIIIVIILVVKNDRHHQNTLKMKRINLVEKMFSRPFYILQRNFFPTSFRYFFKVIKILW